MNKTVFQWTAAMAAALALSAGGMLSADAAAISAEEAKSIAIEHAGVSPSAVEHIRVHEDYDDGYHIYEVDFYAGDREYDYDIDQDTGRILKADSEYEDYRRGCHHRR